MEMAHKAWEGVSSQTITNCFKACGFIKDQECKDGNDVVQQDLQDEGPLLSAWNRLPEVPITFNHYVNIDNNVATAGTLSDEGIMKLWSIVISQQISDSEDEDDDVPMVSSKEASFFLRGLRRFSRTVRNG